MTPALLRPSALVFDMDGLLLDTERLYHQVNRMAAAQLGYALSDALNLSMVGVAIDGNRVQLARALGEDFPFDRFKEVGYALMEEQMAEAVPLRPGAMEILHWARGAGYPLAVATSTKRARAEHHLERTGIRPLLDVLITRDDVVNAKPAPDPYLLAAERLGIPPAHGLAVEDSGNGVRAAHAAGMPVVMVPDLIAPTDDLRAMAVAVLPALADVQAALGG